MWGSLFLSITKESLAMLLHQFYNQFVFLNSLVVILIYIVENRRNSDAEFILSFTFTICQIALHFMPGSFRYHEAILLKQGGKCWKNPSWTISNVWVLPVACRVHNLNRGPKRENHLLLYSSWVYLLGQASLDGIGNHNIVYWSANDRCFYGTGWLCLRKSSLLLHSLLIPWKPSRRLLVLKKA